MIKNSTRTPPVTFQAGGLVLLCSSETQPTYVVLRLLIIRLDFVYAFIRPIIGCSLRMIHHLLILYEYLLYFLFMGIK